LVVPAGAAVPQQPVSQPESQQPLLRRNLLQNRFRIPSSQPQLPQPALEPQPVPQPVLQLVPQLVPHWEEPQLSQPHPEEWNRPNNRLRQDSRPQESQLVEEQEADVAQLGAHVLHESQPQLECLNRFNRRLRQLSRSQQPESQPLQPPPSQPPQDEAVTGAAGAATGAAFAAESAGSAPANQAVVTSTNAAFTRYPPNKSDHGSRRA
jgi:hypothetical protein